MRFDDKVTLVTCATGRTGRACALTFAREGATVVVADVDEPVTVAREIAELGAVAHAVRLDVSDEPAWMAAVGEVMEKFGRLDVLVIDGGTGATHGPGISDSVHFDRMMQINARGTFLGIRHGAAVIAATGGGAIVSVSSISTSVGQFGVHLGYGAARAAITSMTRMAAAQFAADGVRVNAVVPGVLPPMKIMRGSTYPVWRAAQIDSVPMRRAGTAQEMADVVLFLAGDEASYVTGVEIDVDGGQAAT